MLLFNGSIHLTISCTNSVQEKCPRNVQETSQNSPENLLYIGSVHLNISCTNTVQEKCPGTVQEKSQNRPENLLYSAPTTFPNQIIKKKYFWIVFGQFTESSSTVLEEFSWTEKLFFALKIRVPKGARDWNQMKLDQVSGVHFGPPVKVILRFKKIDLPYCIWTQYGDPMFKVLGLLV